MRRIFGVFAAAGLLLVTQPSSWADVVMKTSAHDVFGGVVRFEGEGAGAGEKCSASFDQKGVTKVSSVSGKGYVDSRIRAHLPCDLAGGGRIVMEGGEFLVPPGAIVDGGVVLWNREVVIIPIRTEWGTTVLQVAEDQGCRIYGTTPWRRGETEEEHSARRDSLLEGYLAEHPLCQE